MNTWRLAVLTLGVTEMADYLGLISEAEMKSLPNEHPLRGLAATESEVSANTGLAAKMIATKNPHWLRSLKPRLIDTTDRTNTSSALGEIRAYGALLETWMDVHPNPSVTGSSVSPEFEVENGDGSVIVEVHSRQLGRDQAQAMSDHYKALEAEHAANIQKAAADGRKGNVVTMGTLEVFPYGAPKPGKDGDTVATNSISRIASVKGEEHQIDQSKPFVLWLDLQDEGVWGGLSLSAEDFSPLHTEMKEGHVGHGVVWFALYGRKDDPLVLSKGYDYSSMPLAHEGRFNQVIGSGPSRVSAFVFSLPRATVLMENPDAIHPLPPRFRAGMLKAPFFRLDLSFVNWEPGVVADLIAVQRKALFAAERALKSFDVDSLSS